MREQQDYRPLLGKGAILNIAKNNMKKGKILSILLPMFVLGGLTACGGTTEQSGETQKEENKEEEKTTYQNDKTYHWTKDDKSDKVKHEYEDEPNKTVQATCTSKGKTFQKCKVCNYEKETEVKMLDHDLVVDEAASKASTCGEAGKKVEKCKNCEFTKSTDLPTSAHTFGAGVEKTEGGKTFLEFECSTCHQKGNNLVSFASVQVDGDTATSGKFPTTDGAFGTWNVSLPAGEYNVYFTAKFSSSGANYAFSGSNSRGIAVKYNDVEVEFDGTKTAEDYGLSTSEFKEFTFFKITATGGNDVLALQNPYYRLVFDVASDIVFRPVQA